MIADFRMSKIKGFEAIMFQNKNQKKLTEADNTIASEGDILIIVFIIHA